MRLWRDYQPSTGKEKKLHKLGEEPRTEDIVQQEADLRREVNVLLVKEEKMWH